MNGGQRCVEIQRAGATGPQPNHNHLIRVADEIFARVGDAAPLEADTGSRRAQIEPSTIVNWRIALWRTHKSEIEIAERLIGLLVATEPVFRDVRVSLGIAPGAQQFGHLRKVL